MKKNFLNFIQGIAIGVSVLIPGLSGGTTAIILGLYSKILSSISNISKEFKNNIKFLFTIFIGAISGIYFSSFPINYLLTFRKNEFYILVLGLILGSIPIFIKEISVHFLKNTILIIIGFVFTIIFDFLPVFEESDFMLVPLSFFMAIALILPGISVTNVLITFEYYDKLIAAINVLNIVFLVKIGILTVLFIVLFTKILDLAYKKYPISINMLILGMVVASLKQLNINFYNINNPLTGCVLFICGFAISFIFVSIKKTNGAQ